MKKFLISLLLATYLMTSLVSCTDNDTTADTEEIKTDISNSVESSSSESTESKNTEETKESDNGTGGWSPYV